LKNSFSLLFFSILLGLRGFLQLFCKLH
jgi:hypothetical protein